MPELGTYGSVRGALSNERPYRDPIRRFLLHVLAQAFPPYSAGLGAYL